MFYYNFLCQYLERGYATNGVTLPFLFGIKNQHKTLRELINSLNNLNENLYISVLYCINIEEYVFGIYYNEGDLNYYKKFSSLVLLDKNIAPDYETFVLNMEKEYEKRINAKTFSKINGQWSPYSLENKTNIDICINN